MNRYYLFPIAVFMILVTVLSATAQTIDLAYDNDNLLSQQDISLLNKEPIVHAFIDDYESIAIDFKDSDRYVLSITDNEITRLALDNVTVADYTIKIDLVELEQIFENRSEMSYWSVTKFLLKSGIPFKVIIRLISLMR